MSEILPFKNLPSLNASAIVLSYLVYREDAEKWLKLLSKNTAKYYNRHKDILDSFLYAKPVMREVISFGTEDMEWSKWSTTRDKFPNGHSFEELVAYKNNIKLKQIQYCMYENCGKLTSFKLVFTNGIKSTLITSPFHDPNYTVHTINVDTTRTFRKVSIKLNKNWFYGIRLIDERGMYIVNEEWLESHKGDEYWDTRYIPEGEEIIGLQADHCFDRLGFICYKPSHL